MALQEGADNRRRPLQHRGDAFIDDLIAIDCRCVAEDELAQAEIKDAGMGGVIALKLQRARFLSFLGVRVDLRADLDSDRRHDVLDDESRVALVDLGAGHR